MVIYCNVFGPCSSLITCFPGLSNDPKFCYIFTWWAAVSDAYGINASVYLHAPLNVDYMIFKQPLSAVILYNKIVPVHENPVNQWINIIHCFEWLYSLFIWRKKIWLHSLLILICNWAFKNTQKYISFNIFCFLPLNPLFALQHLYRVSAKSCKGESVVHRRKGK